MSSSTAKGTAASSSFTARGRPRTSSTPGSSGNGAGTSASWAGGIGLAPLRPALHHVLEHRERYGRVVLLYGTRTPEDILYARQRREWRAEHHHHLHGTGDTP